MTPLTRRFALKCIGLGGAWIGFAPKVSAQDTLTATTSTAASVSWSNTNDRVWLGGNVWANPMENWRVVDGAAECQSAGGNRNVHCLTHQVTNAKGSMSMSVVIRQIEKKMSDGGVGFRIGVRSDIGDHRANCFAGGGINAGIIGGQLVLGNKRQAIDVDVTKDTLLSLIAVPGDGGGVELTLAVADDEGNPIGQISRMVDADAILGNVSIVNNFDGAAKVSQGARYRFSDWLIDGDAFEAKPENAFGPILWSMYSLSDSRSDEGFVLKSSVLTGPMGDDDNQQAEFWVQRDGQWKSMGTAKLDTDAWTATIRIPNWDETKETTYKWVYVEKHRDGTETVNEWVGRIRPNPSGRPLRIGALTCQNDYAFPYEPVAKNVAKMDPDLVYFSGDQIYESHGGYGIIRQPAVPAILNYLRKYYQFGWSFREVMRDRPTICLPDDHDVFQGNIWGEGGAPMDVDDGGASSNGGYIEPARMVNVVHITNTAHHPDAYDPAPVKQGISVYYGDMVYGGVGFAILADRQFKSGPQHVDTGSGRADHVHDQGFDTSVLDKPGLILLGDRQEAFLKHWANDWRGHSMKVLLSQTVFAGMATHHGGYDGYLKADLDCGGWPQTPRDRAIEILRPSKALHINGDQHLTSLCQYGVDRQRDSNWSFCTPAIAVGYPRWWRADEMNMPHANRPKHGNSDTGEYLDGLGNKVYVYAVGNPEVATKKNRYEKAHQKASGFGFVTIDTDAKTYFVEAYKFAIDPADGNPDNQFPGWPVTIHQDENAGENRLQ
ncbi:alkaline phosphatase D family protein [Rubripirellula tenax]|nr:alkaline phosphatase D family protein [Rubripirellula tenax]